MKHRIKKRKVIKDISWANNYIPSLVLKSITHKIAILISTTIYKKKEKKEQGEKGRARMIIQGYVLGDLN